MSRNTVIDATKGIGIVCVVLGHIVLYGSGVSRIIFAFHMPLFFFCSGLVFNYTGTSKELLYKAKQLIVPYCFLHLLACLLLYHFFNLVN
nr:acyltransferase family protein [uncultured Treponema sp.]